VRLTPLLDRWSDDPAFAELLGGLDPHSGTPRSEVVVPDVARAFLLAGIAKAGGRLVVVTTATTADAEALAADVAAFLGPEESATFPAWETLPHERLSPRSETVAARLRLLHQLGLPDLGGLRLVTVPARAMMQPLAPGLDVVEPVRVATGDRVELEELLERLVAAGYSRTDMVERRGEVAVRGGLVDFFPPGEDHPVRVELWGDEVESIRAFAVSSQRSLTELPEVEAWPCREVRLGEAERGRARQLAAEVPVAGDLLAQVAEGLDVEGVESLLPLLFDDLQPLTAYLPGDAVLVLLDPKRTLDRAEEVRRQADEAGQASWGGAAEGATAPVEGVAYRPLEEVLDEAGRALLRLGPFDSGQAAAVRIDAHAIEPYRANVTRIAADARELVARSHETGQ
jgi:transcription-repair coupling factor (superfamily II helicase)